MAVGYIYILSNSSVAGLLKIGFTCGSVETRARELSAPTGVAAPFEVEYFQISEDVEAVERIVHSALESFRHSESREFFRVSVAQAIDAIERAIRRPRILFARESHVSGIGREHERRARSALDAEAPGADGRHHPATNDPSLSSSIFVCKRCGYDYFKSAQRRFCPKCGF